MIDFTKMTQRDIKALLAILLAIGYIDIGAIEISNQQFSLVLRGPIFWRITSGLTPYIHSTGGGLSGKAYLKMQAIIAYLMLIDEVDLQSASVGASTVVGIISSRWFKWKYLNNVVKGEGVSLKRNRLIHMLLNLVIGLSLLETRRGLTITGLSATRYHQMSFVVTARELAREERLLPSLLTPPIRSPQLTALNRLLGAMLVLQQLRVVGIYLARGGEVGFGIGGNMWDMKVLPKIFGQRIAAAKEVGERVGLRPDPRHPGRS